MPCGVDCRQAALCYERVLCCLTPLRGMLRRCAQLDVVLNFFTGHFDEEEQRVDYSLRRIA